VIEGRHTPRGARAPCAQSLGQATAGTPVGEAHSAPGHLRTGPAVAGTHADGTEQELEQALTLALQQAAAAYATDRRWEARVRAALAALLDLFEKQPTVARLCVIESADTEAAARALRERTLSILARRIDDGRGRAPRQPPPHAAQAVLAGAVGAIRARLIQPGPDSMSDLLDPLTSFIVLPYRGAAAARGELTLPREPAGATSPP
jgi:hypothetical protein